MSVKGILVCDVAALCGISEQMFRALVAKKELPSPDMCLRAREGYSEKLAKACVAAFAKTGGLFRISHLALLAKTHPSYIRKLIKENKIPAPEVRLLASRFYEGNKLKSLLNIIEKCRLVDHDTRTERSSQHSKESANRKYQRRREMGFFSSRDVADMAGVSCMTVSHHQGVGRIPKPKHEVDGYFGYYYNQQEANEVIGFLKAKGIVRSGKVL